MTTKASQAVLNVLKKALSIEQAGHKFYVHGAAKMKDENARRALLGLAQDELSHIERIRGIHSALAAGETVPMIQPGDITRAEDVFESFRKKLPRQKATPGALKILELAMEAERRSYHFYKKGEDETKDPLLKEFYKRLAGEENEHYEILQNTEFYLKDPEMWYAREERHMADGG